MLVIDIIKALQSCPDQSREVVIRDDEAELPNGNKLNKPVGGVYINLDTGKVEIQGR